MESPGKWVWFWKVQGIFLVEGVETLCAVAKHSRKKLLHSFFTDFGRWLQFAPFECSSWIFAYRCLFQEHQNERIQGCLSWLHQHAMAGPNRFMVRFLEDLSLELFAREGKNVSESSIRNMLTTPAFDYEPNTRYSSDNICCWFHMFAQPLLLTVLALQLPTIWNSLLSSIRSSTSADTFRCLFKTHCFQQAYCSH